MRRPPTRAISACARPPAANSARDRAGMVMASSAMAKPRRLDLDPSLRPLRSNETLPVFRSFAKSDELLWVKWKSPLNTKKLKS